MGQIQREWIDNLRVFYLGGLLVMPAVDFGELADLLAYCRGRGVRTVVDVVVPHDYSGTPARRRLLPQVDYFLPNDDEARRLTGRRSGRPGRCPVGPGANGHRHAWQRGCAGRLGWVLLRGCLPGRERRSDGRRRCLCRRSDHRHPSRLGDGAAAAIRRRAGASATTAIGTTDGVFTAAAGQAFVAGHPLPVSESA